MTGAGFIWGGTFGVTLFDLRSRILYIIRVSRRALLLEQPGSGPVRLRREADMVSTKAAVAVVAIVLMTSTSRAQSPSSTYWLLFDESERAWCGYSDESEFQALAANLKPLESARVVFTSGKPTEVTYQLNAESGDWLLLDRYSFGPQQATLKRTTAYTQSGIRVVQEGRIRKGGETRLSVASVTNLRDTTAGSTASLKDLGYPLDYLNLPVKESPSQFPFMAIADSMVKNSLSALCGSSVGVLVQPL